MRLIRFSWLTLAVAAACDHDRVAQVVTRDGETTIPVVEMNTALPAGDTALFLKGTRAVNTFIAAGPFDTAVADAFSRDSTQPAMRGVDPNGFGYTTGTRPHPVFCTNGARNGLVDKSLPRIISDSAAITTFYASPQGVCYLVQAAHTFNGGLFWEYWLNITRLSRSTRYVAGLARYGLDQRGALDAAELMLTGAVTQPDSLVFLGGFAPGGYKGVTQYGAACPGPAGTYNAIAGANPHLVGSDVASAGTGSMELDVTICRGTAWANDFGAATSPIPPNNNSTLGTSQYNFLVVWEALADSTPNYAVPVLRIQIGPLKTATGGAINNAYGPFPAGQLSGQQLGPLPGSTSRPDTMRLTFNNLKPLAGGAYQVWLMRTDSSKSQLVTGRVVRLNGATVVDTLNGVSEFNTGGVITGARVEFNVGNFPGGFWNAAALAVAGTPGNTTLPASQPLWTTSVAKAAGEVANFASALRFGSFNAGTPVLWGAAGTAVGGIFGNELREDVKRLPRPPMGYMYEAWLVNSTDSTKRANLGPILAPYPQLTSLVDADVSQAPPLSGAEITQAAIRFVAISRAVYCDYDRVQIRVAPKNGNTGALSPTILLSGGLPACP